MAEHFRRDNTPSMAEPLVRTITASDAAVLHFRCWAQKEPRGVIVFAHGIQSHSGWYSFSCARLFHAGFSVYFADRRGAGLNQCQRGHADHGLRLINDLRQLVSLARDECPNVPLTLGGISWGAKTILAGVCLEPDLCDNLVLMNPGLCPRIRPTFLQKWLLWFAAVHEIRHRPVEIPLRDPALFTDDPHWQAFIRDDPLALHTVTTGFLNAGLQLDRIIRKTRDLKVPTLAMLAGRDRIVDNRATKNLLHRVVNHDRLTVLEYPRARHTLEFEPDREHIISDLIGWISPERLDFG